MIVRCRGRSSGWLARPRGKPAGRNRARVSCTAGPRSSVGLLGARTSPQPGLAGINRGPGRLIAWWRPSILYGVQRASPATVAARGTAGAGGHAVWRMLDARISRVREALHG